mmetsp:Transcript_33534/g.62332  ORF Transcript_33534/g.62332 Transcript_33534/m.62332 type:complete len:354 (-) Transcript_33534:498-1559(-)
MGCHASHEKDEIGLSKEVFEVQFVPENCRSRKHTKTRTMLWSIDDPTNPFTINSLPDNKDPNMAKGQSGKKKKKKKGHARTRTGGWLNSMRLRASARRTRAKSWHKHPGAANSTVTDSSSSAFSNQDSRQSRTKPRHSRVESSRFAGWEKSYTKHDKSHVQSQRSYSRPKNPTRRKTHVGSPGHTRQTKRTKNRRPVHRRRSTYAGNPSSSRHQKNIRQPSYGRKPSQARHSRKTSYHLSPARPRDNTHSVTRHHELRSGAPRHQRRKSVSKRTEHRRTKSGRSRRSKSQYAPMPELVAIGVGASDAPRAHKKTKKKKHRPTCVGDIVDLKTLQQISSGLRRVHRKSKSTSRR